MHLSTAFATFFSLSVFSLASAQVYHPTISPTPSNFKTDLVSRLPPANVGGMSNWPEGWIPEACYREAVSRGFSPWNVEVRNVTYADCDRVWAVCRVYSASVDWNSIVQVSFFLARYVPHILLDVLGASGRWFHMKMCNHE